MNHEIHDYFRKFPTCNQLKGSTQACKNNTTIVDDRVPIVEYLSYGRVKI